MLLSVSPGLEVWELHFLESMPSQFSEVTQTRHTHKPEDQAQYLDEHSGIKPGTKQRKWKVSVCRLWQMPNAGIARCFPGLAGS